MKGVSQFIELIYSVQDIGKDILVQKEGKKGSFNVKSYYSSLRAELRVEFPIKEIWEKILTIDMLIKRRRLMVNRCGLCKEKECLLTISQFIMRGQRGYGCFS